MGKSPWVSPMVPARGSAIEVRLGGKSRRVTTNIVSDSLVSVDFRIPKDTLELPALASDQELRVLRAQAGNFDPSRPRPTPPPCFNPS